MKVFFDDKKTKELEAFGLDWLDSPHHHMGYTKGGVDCAKFIAIALVKLKALSRFANHAYYPKDWHIHGKREILIDSFLENSEYLQPGIQATKFSYNNSFLLIPGDCIMFAMQKSGICNHVAFYLPKNRLLHVTERRGVHICEFSALWKDRAKFVFRLLDNRLSNN